MKEMKFLLDGGVKDVLEVYEDHIVIKHKGFINMMAMVIKGEKNIEISDITSIQFKKAGHLVTGYIQFSIPGGNENTGGLFGAVQDENTITIAYKSKNKIAEEIVEYLQKRRREINNNNNNNSNSTNSSADEIEKLYNLFKKGIITEEEYNNKKKRLLE